MHCLTCESESVFSLSRGQQVGYVEDVRQSTFIVCPSCLPSSGHLALPSEQYTLLET